MEEVDSVEEHHSPSLQLQQSESPFTRWRQLRNNPHFIAAVTDFCNYEDDMRYQLALEYASWWPSNVRNFRFELLIILERDISVELLIEREGRKQIEREQLEDFYVLEDYWSYKQLFAFWPRWVEHAHSVLSSHLWTQEGVIRNEFTHRMQIIDRDEIRERKEIEEKILGLVHSIPVEWGDFVPEPIRKARAVEAKRIAEIQEAQEKDVEDLKLLYMKQIQEILKQKWTDLITSWEAGRLRIEWMWEQQFDAIAQKCFAPSDAAMMTYDAGGGGGYDSSSSSSYYSPSVASSRQRNRKRIDKFYNQQDDGGYVDEKY